MRAAILRAVLVAVVRMALLLGLVCLILAACVLALVERGSG